MKNKLFLAIIFTLLLSPLTVLAAEFDPNYIISDKQMTDKDTMTMQDIADFLESKDSSLVNYFSRDFYGNITSADEIIYNAAQEYDINPQALLVMLQKEQSLVENPDPSQYNRDWAMGWHRPDGSDPDDPALQKHKGFGIQVDGAAGLLEWYMKEHDKPGYFLKKKGVTYNIDDTEVTPANKATAALYNYTPHLHGNRNFKAIWDRYFSQDILDGSLVQVSGEDGVWLIDNGKRKPFASRTALVSRYNPNLILPIEKSDLEKYPVGAEIKFPQYALLRVPTGGVYMIDGNFKRPIASQEAMMMIGFNPEEIEDVTEDDLKDYLRGTPITTDSVYPTGALLQDNKTGAVFYVNDGRKKAIIDPVILDIKFPNTKIIPVASDTLDKFRFNGFYRFEDGELVSPIESKSVYVIENGKKRPIISGEVFEKIGYKWSNIIQVPEEVLDRLHPTGQIINISY